LLAADLQLLLLVFVFDLIYCIISSFRRELSQSKVGAVSTGGRGKRRRKKKYDRNGFTFLVASNYSYSFSCMLGSDQTVLGWEERKRKERKGKERKGKEPIREADGHERRMLGKG